VNATVREMQYCTNALATTPLMNIEVFLRFNIIDSLVDTCTPRARVWRQLMRRPRSLPNITAARVPPL